MIWSLNPSSPEFLPIIVALHLGTALALLWYFRRDWVELIGGALRAGTRVDTTEARTFWLLVAATIPAGIIGFLFEKPLRHLFTSVWVVGVCLIINGVILLIGDYLRKRDGIHTLDNMGWKKAAMIGAAQALALIPGISRSGVTLVASLAAGLNYSSAARFSFLMATPIILGAGLHQVPKLFHSMNSSGLLTVFFAGILSGLIAYTSIWILMRYFNKHEIKALRPFAGYCLLVGAAVLLVLR